MKILIPIKRDPKMVPPILSLVRGLAHLGHDVHLISYYHSPGATKAMSHPHVQMTLLSKDPYPAKLLSRIWATVVSHFKIWAILRNSPPQDVLWIASWDYLGIKFLVKRKNKDCHLVYHFHEYEPERFNLCRAADTVVVPEENRSWITYIMARLDRRPLVLPNIPFDHPRKKVLAEETVLKNHSFSGKRTVLYQGYCSVKGRCLLELLEAVSLADKRIVLFIMPAPPLDPETKAELDERIASLSISDRVIYIPSREAPAHLEIVGQADIGIGLYNPTSINQIYCAPNRLYEFTGFGIPVILPSTPPMQFLAAKYPAVLLCEPTNPHSIAERLNSLVDERTYKLAAASAVELFEKEGSYINALESAITAIETNRKNFRKT